VCQKDFSDVREDAMIIKGIDSNMGITKVFPREQVGNVAQSDPAAAAGKFMGELVKKTQELQQDSDKAIQGLMTGDVKGLHEVVLAMEKSSVSFQFMTQVRNKVVEAYQEIMRMQV
jgi:flagellar hook-basal body complex protein FliE